MYRSPKTALALLLFASLIVQGGCADGDAGDTDAETTGFEGAQPFRSDWETVTDWAFDPTAITKLRIGGPLQDGNYANRGDIEVYYTLDADRIVVQMREFTFTDGGGAASADYDRLHPWLYTSSNLARPDTIDRNDPTASCTYADADGPRPWPDNCGIRVYYDGQLQKSRIGADIRVFVPKGWEGELVLETQDNVEELESYPDRGDISIVDLAGSADITLDSGNVSVRLAADIEAAPSCSAQQNADCGAVGWDVADPACATCQSFGRVRVSTRGEQPVAIAIDAPASLWMNATLHNTQPGLNPASDPLCIADVACDDFGGCGWLENDPSMPWRRRVEVNDPGASLAGLGYNLNLASGACAEIRVAQAPRDFMAPVPTLRGDIELCTGCLEDLKVPESP